MAARSWAPGVAKAELAENETMMRRLCIRLWLVAPLGACADRDFDSSTADPLFDDASAIEEGIWDGFVGDIDGDGLDDVALVSSDNEARIVFGRRDLDGAAKPDYVIQFPEVVGGDAPRSRRVVHGVGDINGDGRQDVRVEASEGGSWVIFGRADPPALDLTAPLPPETGFLSSVLPEPIGDLDGDGYDDIFYETGSDDGPVIIVRRGRPDWSGVEFEALSENAIWIRSSAVRIGRLGDFDGDGADDLGLAVGGGGLEMHSGRNLVWGVSWTDARPQPDLGEVEPLEDQSDFETLPGPAVPAVEVFPLGDLNGDGFDDYAAGHMRFSERQTSVVVFGRSDAVLVRRADLSAGSGGFRIDGEARSVLSPGDLDLDGTPDLVLGGVGDPRAGQVLGAGTMAVLSTKVQFELPSRRTSTTKGAGLSRVPEAAWFGHMLSSGDFNGDGAPDLVIGYRVAVSEGEWRERGQLLLHE